MTLTQVATARPGLQYECGSSEWKQDSGTQVCRFEFLAMLVENSMPTAGPRGPDKKQLPASKK
jgi:hypothetical protein